jgi:pimeloyl-ACP methyl ester carboxylesterase
MTTPELIHYEAGGIRYAALAWGRPGDRLALCLHGYPDTAYTWRHLAPRLTHDGWRVVAPFQRGYAPTDIPADGAYQIGALAHDALVAHSQLGGDARAVVIGHDWGATAAYAAAATEPQRFARVVTLAVPPVPAILALGRAPGDLPVIARQLRRSWYMAFNQLPGVSDRSLDRLIPWLWTEWSPGYDAAEDLAHLWSALDSPERRRAALGYYRALTRPAYRSRAYRSEQRQWAANPPQPLLYLHGATDGCMGADLVARIRRRFPPDSRTEIVENAGHFLQLEQPETVNELVATFLG